MNENLRNVCDANGVHSELNVHAMVRTDYHHSLPQMKSPEHIIILHLPRSENGDFNSSFISSNLKSEIVSKLRARVIAVSVAIRHSLAFSD